MHVLLTGQVQVGKTTALTRFLEKYGVSYPTAEYLSLKNR